MPAIQPIPHNAPTTAEKEAAAVLALHNGTTVARTRKPARWAPTTQSGTVPGENSGQQVSQ